MADAATGLAFPLSADGSQSSTRAGAEIVAAALSVLNPGHADEALAEARWRRTYPRHFRSLVEGGLASPQAALASAGAGLAAAWRTMR
jgi:hypothetical protein